MRKDFLVYECICPSYLNASVTKMTPLFNDLHAFMV